jgi:small subunit ribosomal protein S8e
MAIIQKGRVGKKESGGRYKKARGKRIYELGSRPTLTHIGKHTLKGVRTLGGNCKTKALRVETINLFNPKDRTFKKAKIKIVIETPCNRHYVRRNILTKGAIIDTEMGRARVTSRPGQNGSVTAVLI